MRALLGRMSHWLSPVLASGFVNMRTLLCRYGQARSIRAHRPVDAGGRPLPWFTYPAIEYLKQFDLRKSSIFEFGAGNSSRFWATRAARIDSVESDPTWHAEVTSDLPPNLRVHLREDKAGYVRCIAEQGLSYDLIAIDGRWRNSCAGIAPDHLAAGGLIILDNSDWYAQTARDLRARGLWQIDFSGFGPINAYTWTTSVFMQADLRMQRGFAHPAPVGGVDQNHDEDL